MTTVKELASAKNCGTTPILKNCLEIDASTPLMTAWGLCGPQTVEML